MILTTTDIERPYKILGPTCIHLNNPLDVTKVSKWSSAKYYDKANAIVNIHIFPDHDVEAYIAYGTAIRFKQNYTQGVKNLKYYILPLCICTLVGLGLIFYNYYQLNIPQDIAIILFSISAGLVIGKSYN